MKNRIKNYLADRSIKYMMKHGNIHHVTNEVMIATLWMNDGTVRRIEQVNGVITQDITV